MKVGERVIVHPRQKDWTAGAFESLNGQRGVIVEIKTAHDNGRELVPLAPPRALVWLDRRPSKWWDGQQPSQEWWFEEHEVEGAS